MTPHPSPPRAPARRHRRRRHRQRPRPGRRAGADRLLDGAHRHHGRRHAAAADHLRPVARAGQRRGRPRRRRQEAPGRVRQLRRPVQSRAGGAHLREADHRRQGRSPARALGHAVPHRHRAGAREVQVPGGRQHRRLGRAAPDQAGLPVVPDLGDSRPHRRRADGDDEGGQRQVGGDRLQRPAVLQGDQELPRARAEEGGHRAEAHLGVPARRQGHDRDADPGEAGQRRRGDRARLPRRRDPLRQAGQGAGHRPRRSSSSPSARPPRSSPRPSAPPRPRAW